MTHFILPTASIVSLHTCYTICVPFCAVLQGFEHSHSLLGVDGLRKREPPRTASDVERENPRWDPPELSLHIPYREILLSLRRILRWCLIVRERLTRGKFTVRV